MKISDTQNDEDNIKVPMVNQMPQINQNTKNPFNSMKKSKYSAQHVSSIDKTVRHDSFDNATKLEKRSLKSKDLDDIDDDDMEWNIDVSSEEIEGQNLLMNLAKGQALKLRKSSTSDQISLFMSTRNIENKFHSLKALNASCTDNSFL